MVLGGREGEEGSPRGNVVQMKCFIGGKNPRNISLADKNVSLAVFHWGKTSID